MDKKRIDWVDTARFFCMLAVMANHTQYTSPKLDSFVEPFFLNMFTFAAGYVYTHRPGFGCFFRKKLQQLFLPWLCLSTLTIILAQLFSFRSHDPLWIALGKNLLQIRYFGDEMWYVAALFVTFLPFYAVIACYEAGGKDKPLRALTLLLLVFLFAVVSDCLTQFGPAEHMPWYRGSGPLTLPWHLEYIGPMLFFMLLGYLFRRYGEAAFDRLNQVWLWPVLLALYVFVNMVLPLRVGGIFGFKRVLFLYLCALLGVATLIALGKTLPSNRFIRFVGQNTILYYGLHGKAESAVQQLLGRLWPEPFVVFRHSESVPAYLLAVGVALLVAVLLIPVNKLILRWLPFLAGKPKKERKQTRSP